MQEFIIGNRADVKESSWVYRLVGDKNMSLLSWNGAEESLEYCEKLPSL